MHGDDDDKKDMRMTTMTMTGDDMMMTITTTMTMTGDNIKMMMKRMKISDDNDRI